MYVDGLLDRDRDVIHVVERDNNGKRKFVDYPINYTFYYPDPKGKYTSIYGDKLAKSQFPNGKTFAREKKLMKHKKLFESDMNQVFKCLSTEYPNAQVPTLNVGFFDIEVDFNKDLGFAPPDDPFNPVTAISYHPKWLDKTICLAVKPDTLTTEEAEEICNKFENCFLMESEEAMLKMFLDLIDDADVLSGWNSEGFDIPYLVNRIVRVLGKDYTRKFSLWNKFPKSRKYMAFGTEQETFDFVGRVHLDYLQLYKKYTYHEMHSYSLDAIAEHELGESKVAYKGTLDQLYNDDFEKFIAYSIQDTQLLRGIDDKLQFIDLANVLAHGNTVLLQTTMGAVAQTDQAIINEAHERGLIVPDKRHAESIPCAGAYVAQPVTGLHRDICSIDLNSLYPSILRSCNMSTETIVGQIRQTRTREMLTQFPTVAEAWDGKFACIEYELVMSKDTQELLQFDLEDGGVIEGTGAQMYHLFFNEGKPWALSANATIFTFEKQGVVPGLLERWYAERKELQAKARSFQGNDDVEFVFWDKRQLVKKINLNSLYGALLNPGSRFYDQRLGQSTTLTGRSIVKHMAAETNNTLTGEYDYIGKSIIYGDTDSVYFSAYPIFKDEIESGEFEWDKDKIIEFYDAVAAAVNETFIPYMSESHNCPEKYGKIIAGAREVVASHGLFIKKKKYGMVVYDNEGARYDIDGKPGKIKVTGLDINRSDTPAYMQAFLKEILEMVLLGSCEEETLRRIKEFRKEFRAMPSWDKGTPKRVNNLTALTKRWEKTGKCGVGHAMAAINYNRLREMNSDKYSIEIGDGMKTIVCKLKGNPLKMKSIGIPTDENRIPDWYKDLPFDDDEMEFTIITKKIRNLLGVLKWDLSRAEDKTTYDSLFEF